MHRIAYVKDSTAFLKFSYSQSLNVTLKVTCGGRVRWDWDEKAWAIPVATLARDASLRRALGRFITDHGFRVDGRVKVLLGDSLPLRKPGQGPMHGGFRIGSGHLSADLPEPTRGSNLRDILRKADWDRLRTQVYKRAGQRCEGCAAQSTTPDGGRRRPGCHELWTFAHRRGRPVQRLDGLVGLCPDCRRVQDIGRAEANGERDLVVAHLRRVNGWTVAQAEEEIARAKRVYKQRLLDDWDLDLSMLSRFVSIDGYPDLYIPAPDRKRLGNPFYG
jgi:hypothetical protein